MVEGQDWTSLRNQTCTGNWLMEWCAIEKAKKDPYSESFHSVCCGVLVSLAVLQPVAALIDLFFLCSDRCSSILHPFCFSSHAARSGDDRVSHKDDGSKHAVPGRNREVAFTISDEIASKSLQHNRFIAAEADPFRFLSRRHVLLLLSVWITANGLATAITLRRASPPNLKQCPIWPTRSCRRIRNPAWD
jgi:hypothetical protein